MLVVALASAATGTSCTPTPHQTGEAVVIVWPLVMLLACGPQIAMLALWRAVLPTIVFDLRPFAAWVGLAACVAISVAIAATRPWQWADSAAYFFGLSYAAVLLLTTRVWLRVAPKRALLVPHLVTSLVFVPYAIALYFDVTLGIPNPEGIFIVPGYGGVLAAPILLVLLVEAVVRRASVSHAATDASRLA